ncbi:hypothetical protein SLS62_002266 [Diatrype stigma]|uniref:GYF domain-containing protein n=1 Tax=Diatrype stigma TaxID=117547 RepID=A0AAN9UUN7_9PEZI
MSSRFNAARPKRAGESYARIHHGAAEPDSKKVKFDVRNPSALAPDAADDDEEEAPDVFLEADADVIRGGAATKRGAVNIDGYDSDSDQEEMGTLRNNNDLLMKGKTATKDEEDLDDMFAEEEEDGDGKDDTVDNTTKKKSKEVKFLDAADIEGQEGKSRSGGQIRLDDELSSDDDEEAIALAIEEEDIDAEVGLGGLKRHAPKVEAFNLRAEQEEGRFDESGNFVRKAVDPDAVHDRWLEGVSKKDMKRAAEAHEKREAERRRKRREDDAVLTADLLRALILQLERCETAEDALRRLGRRQQQVKKNKKAVPKWKQKKQQQQQKGTADTMEVDTAAPAPAEDPEQVRIREAIDAITDAASKLLERDRPDIYDRERERLIREYAREADEPWVEPASKEGDTEEAAAAVPVSAASAATANKMWEYRWTDGRDDAAKQGPFDGPTMKAWQDAGYFGEGVEFREVDGADPGWSRAAAFI